MTMSMTVGLNNIIQQTCGVGVVGLFRDLDVEPEDARRLKKFKPTGGAGWLIASFTDNPARLTEYQKAERMLAKRFKVVYSSPKRKNKRTGFTFWFHIYDTNEDAEATKGKII